jgi:hypothetical protein
MSQEQYEQYVYINLKNGSYQLSLGRWKRHPDSKWPKSWVEYGVVSSDLRQSDIAVHELALELSEELTS